MTLSDHIEVLDKYGVDLANPTIYLAGEIDGNLATALRIKVTMILKYNASRNHPVKEIKLHMNSCGGDAGAITSVIDYYEELRDKHGILINIHVDGVCMSAATFLVGGATGLRTASKRARFMVHEIQIEGLSGTHTQTKSFQGELNRQMKECYDLYTDFTINTLRKQGISPSKKEIGKYTDDWESLCAKETYLSAEEAVQKGLIDKIL
jgi:ATP-dependent protease ClpP protease subunit